MKKGKNSILRGVGSNFPKNTPGECSIEAVYQIWRSYDDGKLVKITTNWKGGKGGKKGKNSIPRGVGSNFPKNTPGEWSIEDAYTKFYGPTMIRC